MFLVLSNRALGFAIAIGEVKLTAVDNHLNKLQMSPATDEYRSQYIFLKPLIITCLSRLDILKFEFPSTLYSGLGFASLKFQKVGGTYSRNYI